jgi:dTDP-glucose 4,6-dehydratase
MQRCNAVKTVLVTGGAGFIGANFVLMLRREKLARVINLDALTYAGNLKSLEALKDDPDHIFVHGNIGDAPLVADLLKKHQPAAIVNFAAESHVDRSITGPDAFIQTNIVGTFKLLDEAKKHWNTLAKPEQDTFRFLHVSTDEVYGSLGPTDPAFTETTPYSPNSPYAASKASSDHLVRSYQHTYGFPTLLTNCSNNYGPLQFPEKLIPLIIFNCLNGKPLPIYGDGTNVRDWLFVEDHCRAIWQVLTKAKPGTGYNIGGNSEKQNIQVVKGMCALMDELAPTSPHKPHESLITYVKDRPGHDRRYAINADKIRTDLGWQPTHSFETGIRKTIQWYLTNQAWVKSTQSDEYRHWVDLHYTTRNTEKKS